MNIEARDGDIIDWPLLTDKISQSAEKIHKFTFLRKVLYRLSP